MLIECEKTELVDSFNIISDKGASGGKYIQIEGGRLDKPTTAEMSVKVNIPSDGTYSVYAKVIIPTGGNDSYHYNWDDGEWQSVYPDGKGVYFIWLKLCDETLKAGKHVFNWTHREQGAIYDCLFITTDMSKLPKIEEGATVKGVTASSDSSTSATQAPAADSSSPFKDNPDQKFKNIKITGGAAIFEAEDCTIDTGATETKIKGASGNKALIMSPGTKTAPSATTGASIGFELNFEKKGIYSLWARYSCKGQGNDSEWLSLNGAAYKAIELKADSKDDSDFIWSKIATVTANAGTPFTFRIIPRETGAIFDKFIITNNNSYVPSGDGEIPEEMGTEVINFPEDKYPMPTITPPPEHPRVLFKSSDIETIKANMEYEEEFAAVNKFNEQKNTEFDGVLPDAKANYNAGKLAIIESKAFDYVMYGNEAHGKEAIIAIKNYIETCTYEGISDNTRSMGHVLFTAGEVYDWCHPLLTEEDKKEIIAGCQMIGMQMEIGFPPTGQGAVTGHGGEAQLQRDWLTLAIACYDEYPSIYNMVAGRYLSDFTASRNYWYTSETNHQGSSYGYYRYSWDLWAQWLFYRMSGEKTLIDQAGKVPYQWIYTRRPDGQLLREGDDANEDGGQKNKWRAVTDSTDFLAMNFYKDPILKKNIIRDVSVPYGSILTPVEILIFNDPIIGRENFETLPLTKYFASPQGKMVARTGWNMGMNSPDVLAYMKIGEVWAANHNHRDAGNFQIYYKGILASESGYYESYGTDHDNNYNKTTTAHNSLLITSSTNTSGNQRVPGGETATLETWMKNGNYETGEVIGHEFGPDIQKPEYSYIAGDIAKAYDDNVSEATRSMIFVPTEDKAHPAVFVVFDKITTKENSSKKIFMLHMQEEPKVEGNVSYITRTDDGYNGKLTNQTLLPKDAKFEIIGGEGKEYMVEGKNHPLKSPANRSATIEDGWGRIEISTTGNNTDYMLNVMYVSDADESNSLQKAELIETDTFAGAKILGKVCMFNKNKERTDSNVEFTIPGSDEVKVSVAGLKEGTWEITANGNSIGNEISSKDGGIIYFGAPSGKISLKYLGSDAEKTFTDSGKPYVEGIGIRLNGNYLYSDVPATIINDRTLVPMRAIFEGIGADVEWDEATATATAKNSKNTVTITENQTTAYVNGEATELDVPAMILNDRFVVPVRFVSESLGAEVDWNEMGELVKITAALPPAKHWKNIENELLIYSSEQSGDDGGGSVIANSHDGNTGTRWAPEGKDGDAWGIYDLNDVYTITDLYMAWYNGTTRTYYFDIEISEDGEKWTKVIENGASSGKSSDLEKFSVGGKKARYVKYVGGGNTTNLWNSLTEIVITGK